MIAVIRLRGEIRVDTKVKDTMKMLNINKKHNCVLLEDTPINRGMLAKVKDYVTYGEVSEETAKKIKALLKGKVAHLHPPRGGFKSIKRPFGSRGDLGNRGDKMNELIERMLP